MASSLVLNPTEMADALGVSERTVYRLAARDGQVAGVPVVHVGRGIRFSRVQVEAVLGAVDERAAS